MRCLGEVAAGWPGQSRREFHAHSGENSRGKVQNVVVNRRAEARNSSGPMSKTGSSWRASGPECLSICS
jgi:hypothetical protein